MSSPIDSPSADAAKRATSRAGLRERLKHILGRRTTDRDHSQLSGIEDNVQREKLEAKDEQENTLVRGRLSRTGSSESLCSIRTIRPRKPSGLKEVASSSADSSDPPGVLLNSQRLNISLSQENVPFQHTEQHGSDGPGNLQDARPVEDFPFACMDLPDIDEILEEGRKTREARDLVRSWPPPGMSLVPTLDLDNGAQPQPQEQQYRSANTSEDSTAITALAPVNRISDAGLRPAPSGDSVRSDPPTDSDRSLSSESRDSSFSDEATDTFANVIQGRLDRAFNSLFVDPPIRRFYSLRLCLVARHVEVWDADGEAYIAYPAEIYLEPIENARWISPKSRALPFNDISYITFTTVANYPTRQQTYTISYRNHFVKPPKAPAISPLIQPARGIHLLEKWHRERDGGWTRRMWVPIPAALFLRTETREFVLRVGLTVGRKLGVLDEKFETEEDGSISVLRSHKEMGLMKLV